MVYYQSNGPNTINITNKVSKEPIIIAFGGGYYIYAMYVSILFIAQNKTMYVKIKW